MNISKIDPRFLEDAELLLTECQNDPLFFAREIIGFDPWEDQEAVLLAIRDHKRVAVRSCNDTGKTAIFALAALWFGFCFRPCLIVTTATVGRQVKAQVWSEMAKLYHSSRYNLGGVLMQNEWRIAPNSFALGFSTDKHERFAGWHSAHLLFILDEASGIHQRIFNAVEGSMSGTGARLLVGGNPLRPEGAFYECFKSPEWCPVKMNGERHPNIVEGREVIPGGLTREWIEDRKRDWGESDPRYVAQVLGDFPSEEEDSLILLAWAEHAMESFDDPAGDKRLGVDVARFGNDRTVLLVRHGRGVAHIESYQGRDLMQTCGVVIATAQAHGIPAHQIYLDDGGLGGGVTDRLRELGWLVVAVNFGAQAREQQRFANCRSEMYWHLRMAMNPENAQSVQILKRFSALAYECAAIKYGYTSKGQIQIESKDNIRKRIGRSPDLADALALTFAPTRMTGMTKL